MTMPTNPDCSSAQVGAENQFLAVQILMTMSAYLNKQTTKGLP